MDATWKWVSGVSNAVYSTIFGDDEEPETIVSQPENDFNNKELDPLRESAEPKDFEQIIPPIENLQINNNSPLESYTPTIQPSPRANKIDNTKNFDARTKNLHAALNSPSAPIITSASFGSPQKSAFKRMDSPSRVGQAHASPICRPQPIYPSYDSPKKRMHDQTPQKYEDSAKKTKFGNSPQPGGSRSASYNNSFNTSYNYVSDSAVDSPRGAKKLTREEYSKSSDLRSSARETENKKMKHEPEGETKQVPLNNRADSLWLEAGFIEPTKG